MARYNRNRNPAFDNNTTGWSTQYLKAALRRVPNYARPDGVTGSFADGRSSGSNHPRIWTARSGSSAAVIEPGTTYTTSIYVYCGVSVQVGYDIDHCTSSGSINATRQSGDIQLSAGQWARIVNTSTAAAGDAYLSTYLRFYTPGDDTYVGVTCAMVEDGPTSPNYRDGNYTGWAWTGASGNSASQDLDPIADARTAYLEPGQAVAPGEQVVLTAEYSIDPEGRALSHTWDVIDAGGTGASNQNLSSRTSAFPTFTAPAQPGTVAIRLTSTDPGGNSGTDDITVTVVAPAPEPGRALLAT